MKRIILLAVSLFFAFNLTAQNKSIWKKLDNSEIKLLKNKIAFNNPTQFEIYKVDVAELQKKLENTPLRDGVNADSDVVVSFPNATGILENFKILEAPVLAPELQNQYPEIRSYAGQSIENPHNTIRFCVSPEKGVSATIFSPVYGTVIIDPFTKDYQYIIVFDRSKSTKSDGKFECMTKQRKNDYLGKNAESVLNNADDNILRQFRLAQSVTAEYSTYHGGTLASVNAAIATTLTRVNGVFEKDLNVTLILIPSNNNVIYFDAATDPYSDASNFGNWNDELQATLTSVIGNANYDIGHLFGATGGGGNAGCIGCICNSLKGSGITSPNNEIPEGDSFDIDYVAHEMGHQMGGTHTFTFSDEGSNSQKEPGSGTTIMGYAGITGETDVQPHSDPYFHSISIQQITNNIKLKTCPVLIPIVNTTPIADAGVNLTLPIGTPFKLVGTGSDLDNDPITFSWEQFDTGTSATTFPSSTATSGILFRVFDPTIGNTRYFPRLQDLVANGINGNLWEKLLTINRTLNFRLTVRDNKLDGSSNESDNMTVSFSNAFGPFAITSQNTDGISWDQGTTQNITWSVNNTSNLAGSGNVNIKLSTDNGLTYPISLATNVLNDGEQSIVVPNIAFPFCRIMIEPVANNFFAINTKNIAIGYIVTVVNTCNTYSATPNAVISGANSTSYTGYSVNVPDDFTISDMNVSVNISHPKINDLRIGVAKPNSTNVDLVMYNKSCPNFGTQANIYTTFDDAGAIFGCGGTTLNGNNTIIPKSPLSVFNGLNSLGIWRLAVADTTVPSNGTLTSFSFNICSQTITTTLKNENFNLKEFSLFPNPNNGNFSIKFNSTTGNAINIYVNDMRGRQVFYKKFSNHGVFDEKLNLNNIQKGIYLVTVDDGKHKEVRKIIIDK